MITIQSILLQIRKHTYLSMCAFVVWLGMFYFTCAIAITVIPHYQLQIAHEISSLLGQPVDFKKLRFHWRGFKVYAKVNNINIGNSNDQAFISNINSIEMLIHPVKSLLLFRADIDDITINGGRIHLDLKKSDITNQDNFNLEKLQKHLASMVNNPLLHWVNVNQINMENTSIMLNEEGKQSEFVLSALNIYNKQNYNYLHAVIYQINKQHVKNKERELLEIALKFNKTESQESSRFYIATNSSGLTSIVNDYIEPAINKNSGQTKVNSITVDPRTWMKIWGGISNHSAKGNKPCVDYDIASSTKASISQVEITQQATCYNTINFTDELQFALSSPEIFVDFSNDQQFGMQNIISSFSLDPNNFSLNMHHFSAMFAGSHFNFEGSFKRASDDSPSQINTHITFGHTDFKQFLNKLPLNLVVPETHRWLKDHIIAGWLGKADIIWRGSLDNSFPYDLKHDQPNGVFYLQANLVNTEVDYALGEWPKISQLDGLLEIRGREISIKSNSAQISASQIEHLEAKISDLGKVDHNNLTLQTKILTDGVDLQKLIATSPLQKELSGVNKSTQFAGPMDLDLNLDISFAPKVKTKVAGSLNFHDDSLLVKETPLNLTKLNGILNFTEHTITSSKLEADFEKRKAYLTVTNANNNKGTTVTLDSWVDVDYLAKYYNQKFPKVSGVTDFNVNLNIRDVNENEKLTVAIKSNLIGVESTYFEPYNKTKQQSLPLKVNIEKIAEGDTKYNLIVKDNNATQDYSHIDIVKHNQYTDVDIKSRLMVGQLNISTNKIVAKLDRVNLPKNNDDKDRTSDEDYFDWPTINASINKFYYNNKLLGSLAFNTKSDAVNKTFNVDNLVLSGELMDLNLNANYDQKLKLTKTTGNYKINNLGKITNALGMSEINEKLKFKGSYKLQWPDDIFNPNVSQLSGDITIDSGYGRIMNIEPGFARILGLFNISSLSKRLRLDFSDVFEEGFKFDSIKGKMKLYNGIMQTKKTIVNSDSIDVELYGEIDLNKKYFNLYADVTPHVSGLPVAAAIIATPIAGAAVFVLDKILDSPVDQLTEQSYSIIGPWSKPIVTKTKRKRGPLIEVSWFNPAEY